MLKRIGLSIVGLLLPLSASDAFTHVAGSRAPIVVTLNASETHQTIENFGASDAWSMDPIGREWTEENRNRIADLLFSVDVGIGLTAWRFNIGAGSIETDREIIRNPWRRSESFKQTELGPYDWEKQAGQQWFLEAARDRGVETLIAFANAPPVWMTKNGHGQPDPDVGSTNLKPEYVEAFAVFLSDVIDHFKREKAIHFDYISPINEPTWTWDRSNQEGNRYNNEDIIDVINALYDELERRDLLDVKISAPDGVEILSLLDDEYHQRFVSTYANPSAGGARYSGGANSLGAGKYREYIRDLLGDSELAGRIDHKIASHSYWSDYISAQNGDRLGFLRELLWDNLQEVAPGARYWVTEYCILGNNGDMPGNGRDLGIAPALMVARTIHYDLTKANASAWQWWTAVSKENYKDGLIYTDYRNSGDEETLHESKLLWGLGNYSRFIRPGAKRIGLHGVEDDPYGLMGSAYLHERDRRITNVYVNNSDEAREILLRVDHLPEGNKAYELTPYITSESEDLTRQTAIAAANDGSFQYTVPARSIVTLHGEYRPAR